MMVLMVAALGLLADQKAERTSRVFVPDTAQLSTIH